MDLQVPSDGRVPGLFGPMMCHFVPKRVNLVVSGRLIVDDWLVIAEDMVCVFRLLFVS